MSSYTLNGRHPRYHLKEKCLGNFVFNRCVEYGKNICQTDGTDNKSETYESVKLRSVRTAIELQQRNVKPDDVITVCSANTLGNVIPIFGAFFAGIKISNLDVTLSARHIKHLLNLVTPKMIFVDRASIKLIENALQDAQFKTEIVVFGDSEKYDSFADFIKFHENEDHFVPVEVDTDDIALMYFSSGTTGLPKAICHSHRAYLKIIAQTCQAGWGHGGTLHFSTFYWMTAMMIQLACCYFGTFRVFCRNPSGDDIFAIIDTYKVHCMFMTPIWTYKLTRCRNPEKYDLSSLKLFSCGGNPMAITQIEKLKTLFPQADVNLVYGMTEIGVVAAFDPELDQEIAKVKLSSSGKVGTDISMKIVDVNSNKQLGPYQKGEFCVSGPTLMKGYHKTDNANVIDNDGFLKTGDIGYYDEDGCIYVVERIKEMFIYQGYHIVPSAIEEVLLEHPAVKEAVVFGIPHVEDGEVPAACIALKQDCVLSKEEIYQFVADRVADREKLRGGVIFVDALPKTPSGKLLRNQTKEWVLSIEKNLLL